MVRWRTMYSYAALILPIMTGLLYYLLWLGPSPSFRQLLVALLLASLILVLVATIVHERRLRPIRHLNELVRSGASTEEMLMVAVDEDFNEIVRFFRRTIEKRQQIAKKRHRERDRLLTILQYMADGVMILNRAGKVRLLNAESGGVAWQYPAPFYIGAPTSINPRMRSLW